MERIGLIDVDGYHYPNLALMRIAAWHKSIGNRVEWALPFFGAYDKIYASKIFTFTPDINSLSYHTDNLIKGGTGYNIRSRLPEEIDTFPVVDYSIYPQYHFSIQRYSIGCIRKCPFCLVNEKEGFIHPVMPVSWNENAEWIEVFDNNFFANPKWPTAVEDLNRQNLPIKFHGIDLRILDADHIQALKTMKIKGGIHIAWDNPKLDLTKRLVTLVENYPPSKVMCYVLIGYDSTIEQDLWRLRTLKALKITPYVMVFRDYANQKRLTPYETDIQRWANRTAFFKSCDFLEWKPRKNFCCREYLEVFKKKQIV